MCWRFDRQLEEHLGIIEGEVLLYQYNEASDTAFIRFHSRAHAEFWKTQLEAVKPDSMIIKFARTNTYLKRDVAEAKAGKTKSTTKLFIGDLIWEDAMHATGELQRKGARVSQRQKGARYFIHAQFATPEDAEDGDSMLAFIFRTSFLQQHVHFSISSLQTQSISLANLNIRPSSALLINRKSCQSCSLPSTGQAVGQSLLITQMRRSEAGPGVFQHRTATGYRLSGLCKKRCTSPPQP